MAHTQTATTNGLEVVQHGVSMLLRNLGPALRVSLGPVLVALAITAVLAMLGLGSLDLLLGQTGQMTQEEMEAAASSLGWGAFLGFVVTLVVWLFTLSWVAVAWHRHILLEEKTGLLPPLRQDLVWPYLGRSFLLSLVILLLAIPVAFVLGLLLAISESLVMLFVVGVLTTLLLGWVAMRLSLVFPARAVDRPMSFGESWSATESASGGILVVVFVLAVINEVLGRLIPAVFGVNLVAQLLNLAVLWFTAMLGLSVLTTLYGHLVERRALAV